MACRSRAERASGSGEPAAPVQCVAPGASTTPARLAPLPLFAALALVGAPPVVGAGGAPPPAGPSPLISYVATLDAAQLPDEAQRRGELRAAENALARAPGPDTACDQSLGAARHGALHAEVAFARQAVGERDRALNAWRRATDCLPRNPHYRVALGSLLLSYGRLDETEAEIQRALRIAPRHPGLEELQARLAYVAQRWPEAAQRAARIATRLQAADEPAGDAGAGQAADADAARGQPGDAGRSSEAAAFWRLLALLAQRRQGLVGGEEPGPDPALEERWPVPLWRLLRGEIDEGSLVTGIESQGAARRRREMACEALYYTAQQAFATGRADEGRRRLARVVNLKVLYYVEHDMALAELARLRSP